MSETKLLPCPFCGSEPTTEHVVTAGGFRFTAIYCPGCKAQGPLVEIDYENEDEHTPGPPVAGWNRRAALTTPTGTGANKEETMFVDQTGTPLRSEPLNDPNCKHCVAECTCRVVYFDALATGTAEPRAVDGEDEKAAEAVREALLHDPTCRCSTCETACRILAARFDARTEPDAYRRWLDEGIASDRVSEQTKDALRVARQQYNILSRGAGR